MNKLFQYLIIDRIKKRYRKSKESLEPGRFRKEVDEARVIIVHFVKDAFIILFGVLAAGFGLKGFLLPNSFIDGGVTGISLITREVTGVSLSILIVLINIPFLAMGFQSIGKAFVFRSFAAILLLALAVFIIPYPVITNDKLLVASFGGFFLGLGIGLAIRGGAVLDGTEILAIYLTKKLRITVGDIILVFNIMIFSVGAWVLSVETALYAILTYFVASKTVDFVIDGIEEYMGITIISDKSEEIRLAIINKMGRGCTLYSGQKGFAKAGETLKPTNIVFTVITRLELAKLQTELDKIDAGAFIIMNPLKDVKGGMIKKRPLK